MSRFIACLLMLWLSLATAQAMKPATDLDSRVASITRQLRCLVCQNQTIADSQAELAMQLKSQVREQIEHGAKDQDVIDFMVQRYGDFILYRPPFKPGTLLLWLGPFLLLALSLLVLYLNLRRIREDKFVFSEAEIARAALLLTTQADSKESP